jgi:hypothetical protein
MLSEPLQLVAQSLSDHRGALKGFNLAQRALRFGRTLGCSQIVYRLQVQPELRGAAEIAREPHGGIGSDTPALKNDVTNARRAQVQSLGKRVCAQAQGLQVLLTKHFAGVNRPHSVFESHVILPLMRNGW